MPQRSPLLSYALGLCAALFAADLAAPFVLGAFYPGYSYLHDTLSTLGHRQSPVAAITAAWLIAFGLGLGVAAILCWRRSSPGWRRSAFFSGLLAFALGAGVVSGLFPEDLPSEAETLHGKLHGIGAGLGSIGLLIGLLCGAPLAKGRARRVARGLAWLSCAGFAAFLASKAPESYAGLWQKLFLAPAYLSALLILGTQGDQESPTDRDSRSR